MMYTFRTSAYQVSSGVMRCMKPIATPENDKEIIAQRITRAGCTLNNG